MIFQKLVTACVLGVALLSAGAVQATPARTPETGDPAFVVDVPEGWTVIREEDGNMKVKAPDSSAVLLLNLSAVSDLANTTDEAIGRQILTASNARTTPTVEPASIGGIRGHALTSTIVNDSGTVVTLRVVVIFIDATHVGAEVDLSAPNLTPAQAQAFAGVVRTVHVVGVKR